MGVAATVPAKTVPAWAVTFTMTLVGVGFRRCENRRRHGFNAVGRWYSRMSGSHRDAAKNATTAVRVTRYVFLTTSTP